MKPLSRQSWLRFQIGSVGPQPSESVPSLSTLMQQLEGLESRLIHLKRGLGNLIQLQQLQTNGEANLSERQSISEELSHVQQAVDEFELDLATQTIGWPQMQETFWQVIRFGGLGIVIGWGLAWWVYQGR